MVVYGFVFFKIIGEMGEYFIQFVGVFFGGDYGLIDCWKGFGKVFYCCGEFFIFCYLCLDCGQNVFCVMFVVLLCDQVKCFGDWYVCIDQVGYLLGDQYQLVIGQVGGIKCKFGCVVSFGICLVFGVLVGMMDC